MLIKFWWKERQRSKVCNAGCEKSSVDMTCLFVDERLQVGYTSLRGNKNQGFDPTVLFTNSNTKILLVLMSDDDVISTWIILPTFNLQCTIICISAKSDVMHK